MQVEASRPPTMKSALDVPMNVALLIMQPGDLKVIKQITSLDIFETSTKNFHPEGLFSVDVFGKVGTESRNRAFGYIDLKTEIFHPLIFKALCDVRELYRDIMAQKKYAVWNNKLKDFEPSDMIDGQTGMHFFMQHVKEIKFESRNSVSRDFNIRAIQQSFNENFMKELLVLPAGLRDYEIHETGKPEEGEVNSLYRQVMKISNLISKELFKIDPQSVDASRYNMQLAICEVYQYYVNLLKGKSKWIQGRWTSRKVFNSTRNVISSAVNHPRSVNDPTIIKANEVGIGLYQFVKGCGPYAIFHLRESYLSKIFPGPNTPAVLVDKNFKKQSVQIKPEVYDDWMSAEGLEGILNRFGSRDLRHMELKVDNYYLGLIYKKNGQFRFLQDIDELQDPADRQYVSPITFAEFLYISVYKHASRIPGFISRYPITGYGSVYPAFTHLKSTTPSTVMRELGPNWEVTDFVAPSFPTRGASFFDTMAPHASHIGPMGADHDGDMCSWIPVITDDGIEELRKKIQSASYYVNATGRTVFSALSDTLKLVIGYMTK